jgi:hypothetical protein
MNRKQFAIKIESLTKSIDELKAAIEFDNEDNQEEYLDAIESAVISLQELEEIVDRDQEYAYYKSQLVEQDEDCNDKNRR